MAFDEKIVILQRIKAKDDVRKKTQMALPFWPAHYRT